MENYKTLKGISKKKPNKRFDFALFRMKESKKKKKILWKILKQLRKK